MEEFLSKQDKMADFMPPIGMCDNQKVRSEFSETTFVWVRHYYDNGTTIELVPRASLHWRSDVQSDDGAGHYVKCPNVIPAPLVEEIIEKCRKLNIRTITVTDKGWKVEGEMKSVSLSDRNMAEAMLAYWNMMTSK